MSPRTLRRHFGEHGTIYEDLLNDAHKQLAARCVARTDFSLDQATSTLGSLRRAPS